MPHVSSSGGDDLASTDEVKVYNDEGEQEEQRISEDISEEKLGLVTETEQVPEDHLIYCWYDGFAHIYRFLVHGLLVIYTTGCFEICVFSFMSLRWL